MIQRPTPDEYAEYYREYVERLPDGDILALLEREGTGFAAFARGIEAARWDHRYAPGKWSIKEVVGHIIDCERVFALRALAFARGDDTPLPGFDQDAYVAAANFASRDSDSLVSEFEHVRRATLDLFRSLDDAAWSRRGTANACEFTVRAIPWILAGHLDHHARVLQERYLKERTEG